MHLVLDSTGLKVYGEGEWKVRKHGVSKRRTWRKLHLGVDERTGYIYGEVLTDNGSGGDDAAQVKPIIEQTTAPLAKLSGDGAYDRKKVWELLEKENIQGIIPPQKNAVYWIDKQGQRLACERNAILDRIAELGRKGWKVSSGYHRRSLSEDGDDAFQDYFW